MKRLQRIAGTLQRPYNVPAHVLPPRPSSVSSRVAGRRQLEADHLIGELHARQPAVNTGIAVVGVTDHDMWWASEPGPFIFGVVDGPLGYGVISSAHMDPRNFGQNRNEALLTSRVEKMAARYLGLLAFDLQTGSSPDPRSALRGPVVSLDDLDGMTDRLCPEQPGAPHGC